MNRYLANTTLENEMDFILAYKKSIKIALMLGLPLSSQTVFATAVSEVCRELIDKAYEGQLSLGIDFQNSRYQLMSLIEAKVDSDFDVKNEGFEYARKLIPSFNFQKTGSSIQVSLRLSIPQSLRIDQQKIERLARDLEEAGPINAYEEIKMRNARLSELNHQAEQALLESTSLNKQKSEFISMASHELNSPVTILLSYAQLARRLDAGKEGRMAEYLNKIQLQSEKIARLVKQLLDISKIESGNLQYSKVPTSFSDYLQGIVESLTLLVPRHRFSAEINAECNVLIDPMRIEQVLTNLVNNAAKYSEPDTAIVLRSYLRDGKVYTEVSDEGIGMSDETLQRVFDKFYRSEDLRNKYQGLGIGLYVASRIVSDHQGLIKAESQPGGGSTFSFNLPLQ